MSSADFYDAIDVYDPDLTLKGIMLTYKKQRK